MQHIIIADSHAVCRAALENFILHADDDIQVEGVGDYASLLERLGARTPDLILLDHDLPGLPASPEDMDFRMEYPGTRVGIMTNGSLNSMKEASASIIDIFPKFIGSKQFLDGIRKILSGQSFSMEEDLPSSYGFAPYGMERPSLDGINLTPREKQVLSYLIKGAVNKDIARALDLQVVTVKLHMRGICRKMGVKNRTQAALMARECGWI